MLPLVKSKCICLRVLCNKVCKCTKVCTKVCKCAATCKIQVYLFKGVVYKGVQVY